MSGFAMACFALLILVVTSVVWFRKALAVDLNGSRTPYFVGWGVATALAALALTRSPGFVGGLAGGSTLAVGALMLGLVAISRQRVAPDAVRVGARLPEFTALDDDGVPFTLSGIEGRPILLKFFRGHW